MGEGVKYVTVRHITDLYTKSEYKPGGGAYPWRGFVCPVGLLALEYGKGEPPYTFCDEFLGRDVCAGLHAGFDEWYKDRPLPMGESHLYRRAYKVGRELRRQLIKDRLR